MGEGMKAIQLTPEVIEAVNEEFQYQVQTWGMDGDKEPVQSVAARLVTLDEYLHRAKVAFVDNPGDTAALDVLRKIAAIALRPLIEHGCPRRCLKAAEGGAS